MSLKRFFLYLFVLFFCFGLIVTLVTPVFAGQATQGDMPLEKEVIPAANTKSAGSSASNGSTFSSESVSGESNLLKINPYYGVTIIYLQCGHVVSKVKPACCGCSAGKWRYTTDCPKSDPIYVTLPCWRHKP